MAPVTYTGGEVAVPGGRVLVVEDDLKVRAALSRFMSSKGYEVLEAGDGREAMALARRALPDIVLLDIALPVKNGLEVLQELAPTMLNTGFMIVTGNEDEDLARRCLESGAFDYMPKPVDLEALERAVKARLLARIPAPF